MHQTIQRNFIIWTSGLIAVLGGTIALSCLQPPSPEDSLFRSHAYALKHPRSRVPASQQKAEATALPSTIELADGNHTQALELALDCSEEQTGSLTDSVKQVRLSGPVCVSPESLSSTEIRNESNGTSATVFFTTPDRFTTDYISLAPGTNQIHIVMTLKDGSLEEREYFLERTNTASTVGKKADEL